MITPMRSSSRGLVALLAIALCLWSTALPAAAHIRLVSATPQDGAMLTRPPSEVILGFNEPPLTLGTTIKVLGPSGEVHTGSPEVVDNTVRQALQAGVVPGRYEVIWRVSSEDGHPITGRLSFTVQAAASRPPATASPPANTAAAPVAPAAPAAPQQSPAGSPTLPWILAGLAALAVIGYPLIRQQVRRRRGGGSSP